MPYKVPYKVPYAVLRRRVYQLGHAYTEADMRAELQAYVEYQHGVGRRTNVDDSFMWVIKLIRHEKVIGGVSGAEWSKMAPVLALAERLDIHTSYLEHFIAMCGEMARIRILLRPADEPPTWVAGITRRAQRIANGV